MLYLIIWALLWLGPGAAAPITLGDHWFWALLLALVADLFTVGIFHRGYFRHPA